MDDFKNITLKLFEQLKSLFNSYTKVIDNTLASFITIDGTFCIMSIHRGRFISIEYIKEETADLDFELGKIGLKLHDVIIDCGISNELSIKYEFIPDENISIEKINNLIQDQL